MPENVVEVSDPASGCTGWMLQYPKALHRDSAYADKDGMLNTKDAAKVESCITERVKASAARKSYKTPPAPTSDVTPAADQCISPETTVER
jgi:hypothetical protein